MKRQRKRREKNSALINEKRRERYHENKSTLNEKRKKRPRLSDITDKEIIFSDNREVDNYLSLEPYVNPHSEIHEETNTSQNNNELSGHLTSPTRVSGTLFSSSKIRFENFLNPFFLAQKMQISTEENSALAMENNSKSVSTSDFALFSDLLIGVEETSANNNIDVIESNSNNIFKKL